MALALAMAEEWVSPLELQRQVRPRSRHLRLVRREPS